LVDWLARAAWQYPEYAQLWFRDQEEKEIFFGIITRQAIRRGTFRSVHELTDAIRRFIDAYNERARPFAWTKTADQILAHARPTRPGAR